MQQFFFKKRPGTSLVELLLFIGFFALCGGVIISVLITSNDQRIRQQAIAAVEQEGVQILQILTRRIRNAERILDPPQGETGALLTLQLADQTQNPTILAVQTGAIIAVEHDTLRTMSTQNITVSDFTVWNTSVAGNKQSVLLTFTAARTYGLPGGGAYARTFETLVNLFPDDAPTGDACGCADPVCTAGNYEWEVCNDDACDPSETPLEC